MATLSSVSAPPPTALPTVVLFDGECGFCRAGAARAARRLRTGDYVQFVPMQSARGRETLVKHGFPADFGRSMVIIENGRPLTDSAAALALAGHLRWPWKALKTLRVVPRPMRDAAYRWVARHRKRFPGGKDECATGFEA